MFKAGSSIPKIGEIRLGYVANTNQDEKTVHKYCGVHPYLVVSNNIYNKNSGQCEVIPFTTKRWNSHNPVHVKYSMGEVEGLAQESTQLSDPIGVFSDKNWKRAANAMIIQCPMLSTAFAVEPGVSA